MCSSPQRDQRNHRRRQRHTGRGETVPISERMPLIQLLPHHPGVNQPAQPHREQRPPDSKIRTKMVESVNTLKRRTKHQHRPPIPHQRQRPPDRGHRSGLITIRRSRRLRTPTRVSAHGRLNVRPHHHSISQPVTLSTPLSTTPPSPLVSSHPSTFELAASRRRASRSWASSGPLRRCHPPHSLLSRAGGLSGWGQR